MRQSEVRVRAGVEAWHLVKVHWLEYRFRVLWADFTFFLDTGSTQRKQELAPYNQGHSGLGSWHLPERAVGSKGGGRSSHRNPLGNAEHAAIPDHIAGPGGEEQQCQGMEAAVASCSSPLTPSFLSPWGGISPPLLLPPNWPFIPYSP